MLPLTLTRDDETFDKKSIDRLFIDFKFYPGIKGMGANAQMTIIMTTHDEKNDPQMHINEENTLENAFAKCRLAAGVFKNDIEVPWMNFEKVFLFEQLLDISRI